MKYASLSTAVLSSVGAIVVGLTAAAGGAHAQIFQDNSLTYNYGTQFKEPGVAGGADITKSIVTYKHVDGDKWGGDLFILDILFSSMPDNSAGVPSIGAQELYAIYRRSFSYNKITGAKGGYGPIADFGLIGGGDANAKNDPFGAEKRLLVGGAYLDWAVPKGFVRTAFEACHEWNQNPFVGPAGTPRDFNTTFCFESAWSLPFNIHGAVFKFQGFFNVVAPKGFGTVTEVLTRPELVVDVGSLTGHRKDFIEVGVAYEYWLNKFGNDNSTIDGALARTPMFVGRVHF